MKHTLLYSLVLSVSFLSACDVSTGTEDDSVDTGSTAGDQANYNTYVANRNDAISVLDELDTDAVLVDAPANATASLQGTYGISSDDAAFGTELVGDMTMNVDFNRATVSGSLTNNFLDEDGTAESEVTELDGSVNFAGSLDLEPTGGFYDSTNTDVWQLEASATGTLSEGVSDTDYRLDVDLYGNFYDTSEVESVGGVGDIGDVAAGGLIEGNVDVVTNSDSTIYDITDSSAYFVYELED